MADPISAMALGTAASAATASTAATAATAGLFGFGGTFSLGATLSTLGTAFGALSSITAGRADASISKSEAMLNEFNAKQEQIRGREEANLIKRDVARAIASANARGAAGGIDVSSGSPVTAQKEAITDANQAWSTAGTNAKIRAETERVRAQIARQRARNSVRAGTSQAVSILGNFVTDQQDRGLFSF